MEKGGFQALDESARQSARKATTRAAFVMFAASAAMLVAYIVSDYYEADFWTLLGFTALAGLSALLSKRGRSGAAVLILSTTTLGYLAFDTYGVIADPVSFALYMATDALGVVAAGIAAGFTIGPWALALVFAAGGAIFNVLAAIAGPRQLESMIYVDTALLVTALLVLFSRSLIANHARRASEARAEARREAEEVKRLAAEREEALADNQALLRELQHRVRNNLQLLSSLMAVQMAASRDPGETRALGPAHRRIRALALAHDGRFAVKEGNEIDLWSLLKAVAEESRGDSRPEIRMPSLEAPLLVNPARATNCALIVEEFVRGAGEGEADRPATSIDIDLAASAEGGFSLSLRREGGVREEAGHEGDPRVDTGQKLVESLSKQLKAELRIEEGNRGYSLRVP